MKKNDIAQMILVVGLSAMAAFLVTTKLITGPKSRSTKVEVVEKISSDFPAADTRIFNANALDPTIDITIGNTFNNQPFSDR